MFLIIHSITMVINPVNSRPWYAPSDRIFDYNSGTRGFIDPKSIYLSYIGGLETTNAANAPSFLGTSIDSPFLKIETFYQQSKYQICESMEPNMPDMRAV